MTKFWPTPQAQMPGAGKDNSKVKNLITGNRHSLYLTHAIEAESQQPGIITNGNPSDAPAQSTLFAEATPASHSATPGSELARTTTAISGRRCIDLLTLSGRDGCLPRMLLGTSAWDSTMCYLTWKERVTPGGRLLFQLAPSMPDTAEIGCGSSEPTLWQTPQTANGSGGQTSRGGNRKGELLLGGQVKMWPTPNASNADKGIRTPEGARKEVERGKGNCLTAAVMWPTASTRDCKDSPGMSKTGINPDGSQRTRDDQLARRVYSTDETPPSSGQLNPAWVAWLMGFPLDWLDLDGYRNPQLDGLPPEYLTGSPS